MKIDGRPFATLELPHAAIPEDSLLIARCSLDAWALAKAVDAQDQLRVSLRTLLMQEKELRLCARTLRGTPADARISMAMTGPGSLADGRYGYPHLLSAWFEDRVFVLPALHVGHGQVLAGRNGPRFEMTVEQSILAPPRLFNHDDVIDEASLLEEAVSLHDKCEIISWWTDEP